MASRLLSGDTPTSLDAAPFMMLALDCLAKQADPTHSACLLHIILDRFVDPSVRKVSNGTLLTRRPHCGAVFVCTPPSRQSTAIHIRLGNHSNTCATTAHDNATFPRNLVDKTCVNLFTVRTGGVDCHMHVSYTGAALRYPSPGHARRHKCSRCSVGCGSDGSYAAPRRASGTPDAEPLYIHLKHYDGPLT